MNIYSALWILMVWCFRTRASVAKALSTHICISSSLWDNMLTHHIQHCGGWGSITIWFWVNSSPHSASYTSVNQVSIGSDNGLSPIWCQASISTNAKILSIGPLGTNFSEILIRIQNLSFTKMNLKIWSSKWWPFCPGGDELIKDTPHHALTWLAALKWDCISLGLWNRLAKCWWNHSIWMR